MRRTLIALAAAAPLTVALGVAAGPAHAGTFVPLAAVTGQVVPGQYIVTLKDGITGQSVAAAAGVTPRHSYSAALTGFAAKLSDAQLRALQRDPNVAAIEPDQVARVSATQSPVPSWGIDRIDQRNLPLSNSYTYNANGSGVTAYVIDTGIDPTHPDFGGRAAVGYDALGGNGIDCHGHGTHVSGTIGGRAHGVAKGVALRGVRVLGCTGSGTFADVIEGIDWVTANSPGPSVANMSLGGGFSAAVNTATANLARSGVLVAVSAGNSSADACTQSPASEPTAVTTAASDRADNSASFTNHGTCVDLYAPGVSITSTWLNGGTAVLSGTSMASPHVAGVAALYKSANGETGSGRIQNWLKNGATAGVLNGVPANTPNLLLFKRRL
jgi:subtilisin family serine protease